ncbi:MAG: hypothetical protein IT580_05950 [Verrucomicrobiales bacterium]|nr:hypothetical protein [Verrucomicrobiales bacterium]
MISNVCVQKLKNISTRVSSTGFRSLTLSRRSLEVQGESGQTRQMERDLKQRLAGLGLKSIDDLDRFPPLAKLELGGLGKPVPKSDTSVDTIERPGPPLHEMGQSIVALPQTAACRVGDYEVEVSRAAGRVNIKHGPSLETAFVKLKSGECGGEGGIRKAGDGAFVVDQWGVQVLRRDQGIRAVEIVVEKLGAKVIINL